MIRKLYIFAVVLAICIPASAQRHIWSKQGTVFDVFTADKEAQLPRAKRAYSPDRTKYLELSWSKSEGYAVPSFSLITGKHTIDVPFIIGWVQMEAVWSPDSMSFALTGNHSAITESTEIFRIQDGTLKSVLVDLLYHDMAKAYPPCNAAHAETGFCEKEASGEDFNYATVAWSGPATAVIMAEVPCDSLWGGIMCEVNAYELDINTGHIVTRMNAQEFKSKWQPVLAWKFRIPDLPEWAPPPESSK